MSGGGGHAGLRTLAAVEPSPVSVRRLALVAGVAAAIAVGTGLLARTHEVSGAERSVARWVYDLPDWTTNAFEVVMQAGSRLAILVVALVLLRTGRRTALVVGASALVAWGIASPLKDAVGRARPTVALLDRPIREVVERNGFPSSHAAISAALAAALILVLPLGRGVRIALVGVAVATAVARVHLGVHWPLDVVGGAAIGVAVACAAAVAARRWA